MKFITDALRAESEYRSLIQTLKSQDLPLLVTGLCPGARSAFCGTLFCDMGRKTVIFVPEEKDARDLYADLSAFSDKILLFPSRDFALASYEVSSHDFEYQRLSTLYSAAVGDYDIIITTVEGACQRTVPKQVLLENAFELWRDGDYVMTELCQKLVNAGYTRCELVEGEGQFSVRGGIIDLFIPGEKSPVRIEFFGDTIDRMCRFDLLSQRATDDMEKVTVLPAGEIVVSDEARRRITQALQKALTRKGADAQAINQDLERLQNGLSFAYDFYLDLIYERKAALFDYLDHPLCIMLSGDAQKKRLDEAESYLRETLSQLIYDGKGAAIPKNLQLLYPYEQFCEYLKGEKTVIADDFLHTVEEFQLGGIFSFSTKPVSPLGDNLDILIDDLNNYIAGNYKIVICCENSAQASATGELLADRGIKSHSIKPDGKITPGIPAIMVGQSDGVRSISIVSGFELNVSKFVFMTGASDVRSAARQRRHRTPAKDPKTRITSYTDLKEGDYVVHINHGIGIFRGIRTLTVDGVTKDYIMLQYAGTDVLYIPCSNLDSISKYIGPRGDSENGIRLAHLGGNEWQKAKSRVRSNAREIAGKLISLYAKRQSIKGHAFSPDTEWQKEFEDAFEYVETDAQLRSAQEIKDDMEKEIPMDRLLCGDVGFGKTEVAMRGIFKCVMDNMQAAILVPTTILAWQHYRTLLTRFRGFPVKIEMLSRFRTKAQQDETVRRIARGEVDIVVGTHRLLQKDVKFSKLGFLVIDEEQRFGVTHKERLKEMSEKVDVLTLTATPIPRTLSMALSGIRDLSLLEEAPGDRFPVQTYVMEHDMAVLIEAMRRELRRSGQVFYLLNDIDLLERRAYDIKQRLPEAEIATAHGRMNREELSEIWRRMIEGEVDILICTTIIETGVDVPNANTLIIENADAMGLSQLHQIRGRIGRSNRKAYAYLTYRKGKVLSEIASKRLTAIRAYTEFGSGFKIAMRDLEIRGAGNILGAEQHGHMDTVGYEMYIKLLDEAVRELKGEPPEKKKEETMVDLTLDAFIPNDYISSPEIRIDIYKKISSLETQDEAMDLVDELIDRFGDIPEQVNNLITVSLIRKIASDCGIKKIVQQGRIIRMFLDEGFKLPLISRLADRYPGLTLNLQGDPFLLYNLPPDPLTKTRQDKKKQLAEFQQLLADYKEILSGE